MTVFAIDKLCARPLPDIVRGLVAVAVVAGLYLAWDYLSPSSVPSAGTLMLIGFFCNAVRAACRSALRWRWPR
ncbi:hypothetical protein BRDID11002_57760 [Bradyrhizobium diazoefficiens]